MSKKIRNTDVSDHNNSDYSSDHETHALVKNNYTDFWDFVDKNKTENSTQQETHMIFADGYLFEGKRLYNKNFKVENEEYNDFLKLYSKECKKHFGEMFVMEKPKETGPLCLDYDLKQTTPERKVEPDHIMQVVEIVNEIICKYYEIEDKSTVLKSYVLMKKEPFYNRIRKNYSDGFHLQYPNLIIPKEERYLIFEESKKEIIRQNLFIEVFDVLTKTESLKSDSDNSDNDTEKLIGDSESDDEFDGDYDNKYHSLSDEQKEKIHEEVFDNSVIFKNKWFLYGSGKNIDGKLNYYQLQYIFNEDAELIRNHPSLEEIIRTLAIRHNKKSSVELRDSREIGAKLEKIINKYCRKIDNSKLNKISSIPSVPSLNKLFIKPETNAGPDESDEYSKKLNNAVAASKNFHNILSDKDKKLGMTEEEIQREDNLIMAHKLSKLLSKERAYNYEDWIHVGWALFNTDEKLISSFIEFSKKSPSKYEEGCCEKIWTDCYRRKDMNQMSTGYTIASLHLWAKQDNAEGYKNLMKEKINMFLEYEFDTDNDVAKIIHSVYKYEYVCTSIKNNVWWQFEDHKWNSVNEAESFHNKLSDEIATKLTYLQIDYLNKSAVERGQQADLSRAKSTAIAKLIKKLKDHNYKKRITSECAYIFNKNNKKFIENLDEYDYTVGFENGIFDLKEGKFRPGNPADMVSKSTGYNYKEFKETDPIIIEIEKFMESIQPEADMRKYVFYYCASLLEGQNKDQYFMIWTGPGGNGKGTLIDLIDNTLGDYFSTVAPTIITQKKGSSSQATPEMADKKGVRALIIQEPESDDKIQLGYMKAITGQDKIQVRALYSDPFEFIPKFKLLLACNKLPAIPEGGENGTWRRIRVVDFDISFVDNPTGPKQAKKDTTVKEKLPTWKEAFAWLLLNKYYPLYKKDGLAKIEPDRVKVALDNYKLDSNIYLEFMKDQASFDPKSSADKVALWDLFKRWYTGAYDHKVPAQKKFMQFLHDNGCKVGGSIIRGLRIKEENENDDLNPIDA